MSRQVFLDFGNWEPRNLQSERRRYRAVRESCHRSVRSYPRDSDGHLVVRVRGSWAVVLVPSGMARTEGRVVFLCGTEAGAEAKARELNKSCISPTS